MGPLLPYHYMGLMVAILAPFVVGVWVHGDATQIRYLQQQTCGESDCQPRAWVLRVLLFPPVGIPMYVRYRSEWLGAGGS